MKPKNGVVQEVLQDLGISCQAGPPPMALPENEEQAVQVIQLAARRKWRVLPVGLGHQLPHVQPNANRFDLWLSTRRLQKVVLYEPGEATITVQPGVLWQHVQELADGHRQVLSPTFAPEIPRTVGGVIATGFSSLDRVLYGALRHQVLGMRVLMADGSIAKTGGRLVKNVAGFDLHRLHTGARGQLGIVLEASLRLHNRPKETVVLSQGFDAMDLGVAAARRLHSARLPGSGLFLRFESQAACRLSCSLQGSSGLIEDAQRAACLAMDFDRQLRGQEALQAQGKNLAEFDLDADAPWLSITCQPTAIEQVWRALETWLAHQGLQASGFLQPDVAMWHLHLKGPNPAALPEDSALLGLQNTLREYQAVMAPHGPLLGSTWKTNNHSPAALQHAVGVLRQRFDPEALFQARLA